MFLDCLKLNMASASVLYTTMQPKARHKELQAKRAADKEEKQTPREKEEMRGHRLWKHVWEKSKSKSLNKEAAAASGDWLPERCNLSFFLQLSASFWPPLVSCQGLVDAKYDHNYFLSFFTHQNQKMTSLGSHGQSCSHCVSRHQSVWVSSGLME